MKITDIKVRRLRLVEDIGEMVPAWPGNKMTFRRGDGSFVEITTDEGLVGIGPDADASVLETARTHLVGQNPFDIERHGEKLAHYVRGRGYGGAAGFGIALWDIIGKASGQSLVSIFGGGDESVIPYASMVRLSTPEERAETAAQLKSEGWRAIKLRIHHETIAEDIETVRQVRAKLSATRPSRLTRTRRNQPQIGSRVFTGTMRVPYRPRENLKRSLSYGLKNRYLDMPLRTSPD